jgi:hypothetical protein
MYFLNNYDFSLVWIADLPETRSKAKCSFKGSKWGLYYKKKSITAEHAKGKRRVRRDSKSVFNSAPPAGGCANLLLVKYILNVILVSLNLLDSAGNIRNL